MIARYAHASSRAACARLSIRRQLEQKLDLLRHARALLLTSTAEETSSLVAMEAMACGTPVMAFRRGAFPEIVADSETGILVDSLDEMMAALRDVRAHSAASVPRAR